MGPRELNAQIITTVIGRNPHRVEPTTARTDLGWGFEVNTSRTQPGDGRRRHTRYPNAVTAAHQRSLKSVHSLPHSAVGARTAKKTAGKRRGGGRETELAFAAGAKIRSHLLSVLPETLFSGPTTFQWTSHRRTEATLLIPDRNSNPAARETQGLKNHTETPDLLRREKKPSNFGSKK